MNIIECIQNDIAKIEKVNIVKGIKRQTLISL